MAHWYKSDTGNELGWLLERDFFHAGGRCKEDVDGRERDRMLHSASKQPRRTLSPPFPRCPGPPLREAKQADQAACAPAVR
jgi:hypothetical protein